MDKPFRNLSPGKILTLEIESLETPNAKNGTEITFAATPTIAAIYFPFQD